MTPRIRTLAIAGAALAILAVTGCGTLPSQPVVDAPGTTSARMVDGDEQEGGSAALTPGAETQPPTVDQWPGKGPKPKKKPKRNPH